MSPRDLVTRCGHCGRPNVPVAGGRVVPHYRRGNETPCPGSSRLPAGEVLPYAEASRRVYASSEAPAPPPVAPRGPRPTLLDPEG